eukprot:g28915.t1
MMILDDQHAPLMKIAAEEEWQDKKSPSPSVIEQLKQLEFGPRQQGRVGRHETWEVHHALDMEGLDQIYDDELPTGSFMRWERHDHSRDCWERVADMNSARFLSSAAVAVAP